MKENKEDLPEILEVRPGIFMVDRPGMHTNVGIIQTSEGPILIDTLTSVNQIQELLDFVGIKASDVRLVINTHSHSDHTNGNKIFDCDILGHRLTAKRMATRKSLTRKDYPNIVFDEEYECEIGGIHLKMIHTGGHTIDSSVVWLPEEKVLFCGDLLFAGNYPALLVTPDYHDLVKALKWMPALKAEVIVPGHGVLCDEKEVQWVIDYLETSWALTLEHLEKGDSLAQTLRDPAYPKREGSSEKIFQGNIEWMYKKAG